MKSKIILLILLFGFQIVSNYAQEPFQIIKGTLKDATSEIPIANATISIPGTNIGTVTNSEGQFILKIDPTLHLEAFEVSHLSYETARFNIQEYAGKESTFLLRIKPILLDETTITGLDARAIIETAMEKVKSNYPQVPNGMTGFYRESIRHRKDFLTISEAVVNIYKAPYSGFQNDQVKIFKGRKGSNLKKVDTLMVQLQGGPYTLLQLDVVKNPELGIALQNLQNYSFSIQSVAVLDDKLNWVIAFSPAIITEDPLFYGKIFVNQTTYAITRIEFNLDLSDQDKASSFFIQKKPTGLNFKPISTNYLVSYKEQNGKYYLNYARIDLKFKCDWKKRLFVNTYIVQSEMAITDRTEANVSKFENQEQFKSQMIFSETVQDLQDTNFWGENNIIEPEKSIENAIKKLAKPAGK